MPDTPPPTLELFDPLAAQGFEVQSLSHAAAILQVDFASALNELQCALTNLRLPITEVIGSGGGETRFTQRLRRSLAAAGWKKHVFHIAKVVDGTPRESTSHEIDHVRRSAAGVIALEIEWNNKDPFFDRDLENFKRLHAEGAIDLGILITRGASLQAALHGAVRRFADDRRINSFDDLERCGVVPTPKQRQNVLARTTRKKQPVPFADAWADNFVGNKYGQATTHWDKLLHRVQRGVGNPCPLLLIGLPHTLLHFDKAEVQPLPEDDEDTTQDGSTAAGSTPDHSAGPPPQPSNSDSSKVG